MNEKAIERMSRHDVPEQTMQMGLFGSEMMDVVGRSGKVEDPSLLIAGMELLQGPVSNDRVRMQSLYGSSEEQTLAIVVHNPSDGEYFVHLMAFSSLDDYGRGVELQTMPDEIQVELPS